MNTLNFVLWGVDVLAHRQECCVGVHFLRRASCEHGGFFVPAFRVKLCCTSQVLKACV